MDKGSALEGFAALYDGTGNSETYAPCDITCHMTLEYELVRKCQIAGDRPHKGSPLGKLPELYPFDMLKRQVVAEAQRFVSQVLSQGYEALEPVYTMRLWGPYTEKVGQPRDWVPEEGNHTIQPHDRAIATTAWGYQSEDELDVSKGVAFLLQGKFQRRASLGHIDEGTGVILV